MNWSQNSSEVALKCRGVSIKDVRRLWAILDVPTYLPMSDVFYTMIFTLVRFLLRYLSQKVPIFLLFKNLILLEKQITSKLLKNFKFIQLNASYVNHIFFFIKHFTNCFRTKSDRIKQDQTRSNRIKQDQTGSNTIWPAKQDQIRLEELENYQSR